MNQKTLLPVKDKNLISIAIYPAGKNPRQSDDQNHSLVEGTLIYDMMYK
ncbi:MAG: hypothetical protein NTV58_00200 [Deltaproteobacteria bacterium]|nr:hypothetical protein [Deltaproteobacteria bacterium]